MLLEREAQLDRLSESIRTTVSDTTGRLVMISGPAGLGKTALLQAARELGEQAGMQVRFRVDGEAYPLGVDVEIALLRVAQSALANVTQHAKANTAVVTLTYLSDAVTLDVADDGVGFDPAIPCAHPGRGFGLPAIRQRIEALGGSTTVESAPSEGTMLAVTLPVSREGEG